MLIEARRAAGNERAQLARGGVEAPGDVYATMRLAYPSAFASMIVEGAVRGLPSASIVMLGAALFVTAKMLKWWAILALGPSWTFRVITVPSSALVTGGPYALWRHPNYIAVIGELVGIAMMTGAWLTGPLVTLGFALLIRQRIIIEERALHTTNP
jgi:methyltransferase